MSSPQAGFSAGLAFTFGAVFFWGSQVPVAKVLLESMDSFAFGALRYLIALLGFAPLLLWREGWRAFSLDGQAARLLVAGGIGMGGSTIFVFLGLALTRAESAAIILALQPGMAAIGYWLVEQRRPPLYTLVCLAVAFVGVLLVITRGGFSPADHEAFSAREWLGNLFVLMGSAAWVTYVISASRLSHWSAARLSTLGTVFSVVVLSATWVIAGLAGYSSLPTDLSWADTLRLVYVSVGGAMIAMFWWNAGVRRIGPLNGALFAYLMPVFAFGVRALEGARFTAGELAGVAIVIGSLAINNLLERRSRALR